MPSKPKRPVLPPATGGDTSKVYPFSEDEYNKGVAALKNNEAADRDDILVEQLKLTSGCSQCSTYASWRIRSRP